MSNNLSELEDMFEYRIIDYIMEYFGIVILLLPLIALLIYAIIDPESVATWGYSLKYKERPDPTEGYVKYTRVSGVIGLLFILLGIIISINALYGMIFFLVLMGGGLYYLLIKES